MTASVDAIIADAAAGAALTDAQALALEVHADLDALLAAARARRDLAHAVVSYSPKVFIPLTQLCRDVCRYCTFAHAPRDLKAPYLSVDEAVAIAQAGAAAGCHEALFTLGDQPERRYRVAREALAAMGHATTIDYLVEVARRVHEATGLLPHVNPGIMSRADLERLRAVSVSAGLMLESSSARLCAPGGPHYGCPDKLPEVRLETIRLAGEAAVPFTSGILIGIGETSGRAHRSAAGAARAAWPSTAICRRSSSRTFGPSPARAWRQRPSPRSTSICGRSPRPA